MDNQNKEWPEDIQKAVWAKAPYIDIRHPKQGKFDPCRACIKEEEYGNQDSDYGWQIDHIFPEKKLQDAGVPQELIDHIDNLRPMHHKNNNKKSYDFPIYTGIVSAAGTTNYDVIWRKYSIKRNQISILQKLFRDYLDIPQPSILGQWQTMIGFDAASTVQQSPNDFFDEIVTQSIHDLDEEV